MKHLDIKLFGGLLHFVWNDTPHKIEQSSDLDLVQFREALTTCSLLLEMPGSPSLLDVPQALEMKLRERHETRLGDYIRRNLNAALERSGVMRANYELTVKLSDDNNNSVVAHPQDILDTLSTLGTTQLKSIPDFVDAFGRWWSTGRAEKVSASE